MKNVLLLLLSFISLACATSRPANLVSWDGKNGKVRQALFGPFYENKVEPEMDKLMTEKCSSGFEITKIGSDIVAGAIGSAEAKFKEFKCK